MHHEELCSLRVTPSASEADPGRVRRKTSNWIHCALLLLMLILLLAPPQRNFSQLKKQESDLLCAPSQLHLMVTGCKSSARESDAGCLLSVICCLRVPFLLLCARLVHAHSALARPLARPLARSARGGALRATRFFSSSSRFHVLFDKIWSIFYESDFGKEDSPSLFPQCGFPLKICRKRHLCTKEKQTIYFLFVCFPGKRCCTTLNAELHL